jgi:hypothetical protein
MDTSVRSVGWVDGQTKTTCNYRYVVGWDLLGWIDGMGSQSKGTLSLRQCNSGQIE